MSADKQSDPQKIVGIEPPLPDNLPPSPLPDPSFISPASYEIRIKDHLETYWCEWFEGWVITNLESGEVLLRCNNVDQSALHGTLNKIRDLNLTLLSVYRI